MNSRLWGCIASPKEKLIQQAESEESWSFSLMVTGLSDGVERMNGLQWETHVGCSPLQKLYFLMILSLPPLSLVLPCGSGGWLWSQDNHLIVAERCIVVIFDGMNKEVYVNMPNECTSSDLLGFFLWFLQSKNKLNCSYDFSCFINWQRRSKIIFGKWVYDKFSPWFSFFFSFFVYHPLYV